MTPLAKHLHGGGLAGAGHPGDQDLGHVLRFRGARTPAGQVRVNDQPESDSWVGSVL
jgi:hypothetical protein